MFYQRKICTCFPEDFISFRRPTSGRVSLLSCFTAASPPERPPPGSQIRDRRFSAQMQDTALGLHEENCKFMLANTVQMRV